MTTLKKKLNWFYRLRDFAWNTPNSLDKIGDRVILYYKRTRPISHIIIISIVFFSLGSFTIGKAETALTINEMELIEGVIIGQNGRPKIVNPILLSDNPVETDLASLVYEGMIRLDLDGEIVPVLAERWEQVDEDGLEFEFHLKQDVLWHDGSKLKADDVVATFEILRQLGNRNYYSTAANDISIKQIDDYTVKVTTDTVKPTLFETLQWGVMPEHVIHNANPSTFSTHSINQNPVGTGPFMFSSAVNDVIILNANEDYHGGDIKITSLKFILFEDISLALEALQIGQIHQIANPPIEVIEQLNSVNNISTIQSNPLYQIYWGVYFNLKKNGPEVFQEKEVRQAITMGINKQRIITEVYNGAAEEALGPIPKVSWAFDTDLEHFQFNQDEARLKLQEEGWEIGSDGIREKDGLRLEFSLSHLDSSDKNQIAEFIAEDLQKIGVQVNLDPQNADDLRNAYVAAKNFETLLYAVETPIDPDRLDFFHTDAIIPPGRNLSSYESEEKRSIFDDEGEKVKTGVVDIALQNGFSSLDEDRRLGISIIDGEESETGIGYYKFQELVNKDAPVVFLFHPKFTYITRSRVKGIQLDQMGSQKDRFLNIEEWYIEV